MTEKPYRDDFRDDCMAVFIFKNISRTEEKHPAPTMHDIPTLLKKLKRRGYQSKQTRNAEHIAKTNSDNRENYLGRRLR